MRAVVSATGVNTFFGKTAMLVEKAEKHSHFQDAVLRIGNFLILNTLWLVALIVIVALFRGDPMVDTILFALVLTVAAIPVALPAVLSVTMAVGASTLAAMRAIVSRLVSLEEMAGMDVLCSDKTGTLTKNQLVLGEPVVMGGRTRDAPALKQADVGIAVSGATDAARAAADLVLTEPGLSVITRAVEEARRIFERMNAYAIYRIAETIRVLLFMTLSIVAYNFYPVTAVMIVLIAILNDFPIMMIAYDNQPVAPRPVRWDMHRVLMVSSALGLMGVIESFLLLWIAKAFMALPAPIVQTVIFLKLLVAGHLTIYITRNVGKIWDRPWPNWKFFTACETTQAIGTLAAVYGWFVTPIGWEYALGMWGYALVWFLVESAVKISTYRMLRSGTRLHERHLARIGASFNSHAP